MPFTSRRAAALLLALTFILAHAAPVMADPVPGCDDPALRDKPLVIRVGVVSYSNFKKTSDEYTRVLAAVAENAARRRRLGGRKVVFRLSVGSYSDVFDWYGRDLIDIAFLTPTLVANLRTALRDAEGGGADVDERLSALYVATHDSNSVSRPNPAPASLTHAVGPGERPRFDYRVMAAVREDSPLRSYADLKREADRGQVRFLFIDPLSASGRVLPEYFLRHRPEADQRIVNFSHSEAEKDERAKDGTPGSPAPAENTTAYTYSPKHSLEELSNPPSASPNTEGTHSVAFFYEQELSPRLRRLSIPELESVALPEQALFISHGFLTNKACVEALFDVHNAASRFQNFDARNPRGRLAHESPGGDWLARYAPVFEWVEKLNVSATSKSNQLVTLDQIADVLRTYNVRYERPARLALVLSGGGAKCAYQLGAIEWLEAYLGNPPEKEGETPVDIDLVVGTSGGAINALTVALGLTRPEEGDIELLKETWIGFNQRDFFSPWPVPYFILGVCSGLLQALLLLWAFMGLVALARMLASGWMKARFNLLPGDLWRACGFAVALAALVNVGVWVTEWNGVPFRTTWHVWHHAWLLLTINTLVSGLVMAAVAAVMILRVSFGPLNLGPLRRLHLVMRNGFAFGLGAVLVLSLFSENTLSRSDGVDDALLEKMAHVVDPNKEDEEMRAALATGDKTARFRAVSKVISKGLQRDLIITGSRLSVEAQQQQQQQQQQQRPPEEEDTQPSDLYFYYDHGKCTEAKGTPDADACDPDVPATDKRFKRFASAGDNLMDVVVGSSSIYPIFPARRLEENVKIIDGGFAHNSPIDAAVKWGATHIILIEASPTVRPQESRFLYNAVNAFNHLYYQAQLLDARARGKVEIFTLRPKPSANETDLCTFDFHDKLVEGAIKRGFKDATGTKPHFRRESGEPVFRQIGVDELTERKIECPCKQEENLAAARP